MYVPKFNINDVKKHKITYIGCFNTIMILYGWNISEINQAEECMLLEF